MKNISEKELRTLYLDGIDFAAADTLDRLANAVLDAGGEIVSVHLINASKRGTETNIQSVPSSYIRYILNDYMAYIEMSRSNFWIFEGAYMEVEKLNSDGTYNSLHYMKRVPMNLIIGSGLVLETDYTNMLHLALNPSEAILTQERIPQRRKDDREYTSRKRKIERIVYTN